MQPNPSTWYTEPGAEMMPREGDVLAMTDWRRYHEGRKLTGVQRMMLAMLIDAADVVYRRPTGDKQYEVDLGWINGAGAQVRFADACEHLGLDPTAARQALCRLALRGPAWARPPRRGHRRDSGQLTRVLRPRRPKYKAA